MTLRAILSVALGLALGAALTLSETANAAASSKKHQVSSSNPAKRGAVSSSRSHVWSGGINGTGPLYFGQDYLGTDPDPNIRFQILRDITGHYGGGGD